MNPKNRVNYLVEQINKHRNLYYNEQPEISDAAFDLFIDELTKLDSKNEVLSDVGAPAPETSQWEKYTHTGILMSSLDKATSNEEIIAWVNKYCKPNSSIFYSLKIDGISINCAYENGKLVACGTRGRNGVGENIYRNVIKMRGVKQTLPTDFTGSLRGEILLTNENHKKYFSELANPRNAASGIAKRLSGENCDKLDVLFYQAIGNVDHYSEHLQLQYIEKTLGLQTPNYDAYVGATPKDISNYIIETRQKYVDGLRNNLKYLVDGLVFRVNNLEDQVSFGYGSGDRPRAAVAIKFKAEDAISKVIAIENSVGNSGRIVPVVIVKPVRLAGTIVQKASLYNYSYVKGLGIDVGAEVMISKKGEIIPAVSEVVKSTGTIFPTPTNCPVCDGKLEMRGENLQCISVDTCLAQANGRILNWISSNNILEWGESLISKLITDKKISTIVDLYKLSIDELASLDRMGKKSAENCFNSLWSHNPIPLNIFLGSLSIPGIGISTIDMLIDNGLNSIDKILNATIEQIALIKGLGPVKASSLYNGLKRNKEIINGLFERGIAVMNKEVKNVIVSNGKLNGQSFVITGKTNIVRKNLQQMIEDAGGVFEKAVSKTTNFLVIVDTDSDTKKAVSARANGTKLISEDELLSMIG